MDSPHVAANDRGHIAAMLELHATPSSVNVFGDGRLIEFLRNVYPEGWYGGQLPKRGFWGASADCDAVIQNVASFIAERA